jgi:hypothetical protein
MSSVTGPNGTRNGFSGRFYKIVWPLIRLDVMNAINAFWSLDSSSFHPLNDAYIVLLQKKAETAEIKYYRPISLKHSFGKLVSITLLFTTFSFKIIYSIKLLFKIKF